MDIVGAFLLGLIMIGVIVAASVAYAGHYAKNRAKEIRREQELAQVKRERLQVECEAEKERRFRDKFPHSNLYDK